jgi:hypothetical protein
MVVDQVDVAGGVRFFVVTKSQAPVSGDGQALESFEAALERVQLPSWKSPDLVEAVGGFEGKQKLAKLVGHRGRHPSGVAVFMKLPQPFVTKWAKLHFMPATILVCTVLPYTSSTVWFFPEGPPLTDYFW